MKKIWPSVLFAAILLMPASPAARAGNLADTDLPGGDYRNFSLISPVPSFCANVCAQDSRCKAWTFSWPGKRGKRAKCFLKEKVAEKKHDTCCISGLKSGVALPGAPSGDRPEESAKPSALQPPAEKPETAGGAKPSGESAPPEVEKRPLPPVETPPAGEAGKPSGASPPASSPPGEPGGAEETGGADAPPREQAPPPGENDADRRARCTAYAEQAVRASEAARRLNCGFSGGRWNATYRGYFNWCMKNPAQAAEKNTQARSKLLVKCRTRPARPQPPGAPPIAAGELESCARFTQLAAAMARRALRNRCGFFGPRWTTDEGRIYEWCRQTPISKRRALLRANREMLSRCLSGASGRPGRPPRETYGLPGGNAPFLYKWTKLRGPGPSWSSPWRPSRSGKCALTRNCDCGGGSTCRMYDRGEAALVWPAGCRTQPWVIVCNVRRRR